MIEIIIKFLLLLDYIVRYPNVVNRLTIYFLKLAFLPWLIQLSLTTHMFPNDLDLRHLK